MQYNAKKLSLNQDQLLASKIKLLMISFGVILHSA